MIAAITVTIADEDQIDIVADLFERIANFWLATQHAESHLRYATILVLELDGLEFIGRQHGHLTWIVIVRIEVVVVATPHLGMAWFQLPGRWQVEQGGIVLSHLRTQHIPWVSQRIKPTRILDIVCLQLTGLKRYLAIGIGVLLDDLGPIMLEPGNSEGSLVSSLGYRQ